nr:MAG TPA: hypothetical protein [Caudoviricetes sp.]
MPVETIQQSIIHETICIFFLFRFALIFRSFRFRCLVGSPKKIRLFHSIRHSFCHFLKTPTGNNVFLHFFPSRISANASADAEIRSHHGHGLILHDLKRNTFILQVTNKVEIKFFCLIHFSVNGKVFHLHVSFFEQIKKGWFLSIPLYFISSNIRLNWRFLRYPSQPVHSANSVLFPRERNRSIHALIFFNRQWHFNCQKFVLADFRLWNLFGRLRHNKERVFQTGNDCFKPHSFAACQTLVFCNQILPFFSCIISKVYCDIERAACISPALNISCNFIFQPRRLNLFWLNSNGTDIIYSCKPFEACRFCSCCGFHTITKCDSQTGNTCYCHISFLLFCIKK